MPRRISSKKGTALYQAVIPSEVVEALKEVYRTESDSRAIAEACKLVYSMKEPQLCDGEVDDEPDEDLPTINLFGV